MKRLAALYTSLFAEQPKEVVPVVDGAGSNRAYYRLRGERGQSVIGVVGTMKAENEAFVYLSKHLREQGLPVPEVYAVSADGMCYIEQDLGSRSLYDALAQGRERGEYNKEEVELLKRTVSCLPALQFKGDEGLDYSRCYPLAAMDRTSIFFDLNYFKYCFLKPSGIEFNEVLLEEDFRSLADDLMEEQLVGFMYRDCQARNVMLCGEEKKPFFIDFQGGRRGPYYYDLASFLWQASAHYSRELREELIDTYYTTLRTYTAAPERETFNKRLRLFALFRMLQVLGAYGFRGLIEHKPYFVRSIPYALENVLALLSEEAFPYPSLCEALVALAALPQYSKPQSVSSEPQPLRVTIVSFAYKYGLPADESGNGGGYIFDCRGCNNPGRYPEFRSLTGLDEEVERFIEDDRTLLEFLANVYKLVDAHIENYLSRGFNSLMVAFGCTGGRHRSVYAAEHLAAHVKEKYGVEVYIHHREHDIKKVL